MKAAPPICRGCGGATEVLGTLSTPDGPFVVGSCAACGCRSVDRTAAPFDELHKDGASTYGFHEDLARAARAAIDSGHRHRVRRVLGADGKFARIIARCERHLAPGARVVELGCSRGYFAGVLAALGFEAIGVDVAEASIDAARARFPEASFQTFDACFAQDTANALPVDAVVHAGLIGCVDDPTAVLANSLELLRPGGWTFFNAPNVAACLDRLWLRGTLPPDLVTLFPPSWWCKRMTGFADVDVAIDHEPTLPGAAPGTVRGRGLSDYALRVLRRTPLRALLPTRPTEFGVHVAARRPKEATVVRA